MEIANANAATLSNYEVMNHLQNLKERRTNNKGHLATITYETLKYLDNSACAKQSAEDIKNCLKEMEQFNLTKNEKLTIINNPPTTPLEMQLFIEESEERLSEHQVDTILNLVAKYLHVTRKIPQDANGDEDSNQD